MSELFDLVLENELSRLWKIVYTLKKIKNFCVDLK